MTHPTSLPELPAHVAGRRTEGRALGRGSFTEIPNLGFFASFRYTPGVLSNGVKTEKPYYCYGGASIIVKGTCDAEPVRQALAREGLHPVLTADGRAMASLWVNEIGDSVIGGYHEIALSFDAADREGVRADAAGSSPYGLAYNYLGGECLNFIHTLWISSPLSIRWGREMQAFPKHPRAVDSRIEISPGTATFSAAWGERLVVKGRIRVPNAWANLPGQMLGVSLACGPLRLLRFTASPVVRFTTIFPRSTRREHGVTCAHLGHLYKGLSPAAVLVYPWSPDDSLEWGTGLGDLAADDHESPTDLLVAAHFQPRMVTCLQRLQLVIEDHPAGLPAAAR